MNPSVKSEKGYTINVWSTVQIIITLQSTLMAKHSLLDEIISCSVPLTHIFTVGIPVTLNLFVESL